jgi:hypothetical protein
MTLVSICGDLGSGKTLLLTLMAIIDDRPVRTNYKIEVKSWERLTVGGIERVHNSFVGIDEAYTWMEARLSGSGVNIYMSHISFQSRKREVDIVITIQLNRTVDVRFRELSDLVIVAQKLKNGYGYTVYRPAKDRIVCRFLIPFDMAELIYPYYDSWEQISSKNRFLLALIENDVDELNRILDEMVGKLHGIVGNKRVDQHFVNDFCVRYGYPSKFSKMVYDRMVSPCPG